MATPEEREQHGYRFYADDGDEDALREPVEEREEVRPRPRPQHCGFSTEDLECLGCGMKLGCVVPGECYAVSGKAALWSAQEPTEGRTG